MQKTLHSSWNQNFFLLKKEIFWTISMNDWLMGFSFHWWKLSCFQLSGCFTIQSWQQCEQSIMEKSQAHDHTGLLFLCMMAALATFATKASLCLAPKLHLSHPLFLLFRCCFVLFLLSWQCWTSNPSNLILMSWWWSCEKFECEQRKNCCWAESEWIWFAKKRQQWGAESLASQSCCEELVCPLILAEAIQLSVQPLEQQKWLILQPWHMQSLFVDHFQFRADLCSLLLLLDEKLTCDCEREVQNESGIIITTIIEMETWVGDSLNAQKAFSLSKPNSLVIKGREMGKEQFCLAIQFRSCLEDKIQHQTCFHGFIFSFIFPHVPCYPLLWKDSLEMMPLRVGLTVDLARLIGLFFELSFPQDNFLILTWVVFTTVAFLMKGTVGSLDVILVVRSRPGGSNCCPTVLYHLMCSTFCTTIIT